MSVRLNDPFPRDANPQCRNLLKTAVGLANLLIRARNARTSICDPVERSHVRPALSLKERDQRSNIKL